MAKERIALALALLILLASTTALAQLIRPQSIVALPTSAAPEGEGLINAKAHSDTISFASKRLPVMAQSITGVPTYSAITRWQPGGIPLIWIILFAAIMLAVATPSETLKKYTGLQEIPFIEQINKLYVYLAVFFIVVILWMGTNSSFQYSMYYLGANLAALVLADWFGKKFDWYRDFKMGLAMDHGILGYNLSPATRMMSLGVGTIIIAYFLAAGNMYIASPTYAAGEGDFQNTMSRIIPVIPEDLLWFRLVPTALLILFMKGFLILNGIIQNTQIKTLKENRDMHPRAFFTSFVIGIVLVSAFCGLVLWPSYHDATYGAQARQIALATGQSEEEVKTQMLNSVANFGFVGTFVTLSTGSTVPADIMHAMNNLNAGK